MIKLIHLIAVTECLIGLVATLGTAKDNPNDDFVE